MAKAPEQFAAEYRIGWNKSGWGRQPTHYQPELEESTGATNAPRPPASTNQYLYSGFTMPNEVNVLIVSRLWLITTCILAAFAVGMLLLYTPIAKNVSFWLLLTLALTVGAFSYPEFILFAVQAIFWGGVMTLSAILLKKVLISPASQPELMLATSVKPASTAVTESWIHGQPVVPFNEETETTSIQAGGPVP